MSSKPLNINTIYDLLELIRPRVAMYTGGNSLSLLNAFLEGYYFSKSLDDIQENGVFPPFWYFHEWTMEKYNWIESTAGWKNIILIENKNDEEKSLHVFFEMIEDFKKLHPISILRMKISAESLALHHSDKCESKRKGRSITELSPNHEEADELLLIEFSHSFGFSIFVLNKNKVVGDDWTKRFKDINSAKQKIEALFGSQNNFEQVNGDLTVILKQVL